MSKYSHKKGRNIKKSRKIRRKRGGVKTTRQIQAEFMKNSTPITDPKELRLLAEYERNSQERERNNNEIININNNLESQRNKVMKGWAVTPMSPEDIRKQEEQDVIDNERVNSKVAKERKLTIYDLGGSKRKKTIKKRHRNHRMKGGDVDKLGDSDFNANLAYDAKQYGGQNIGANCYDPNFSIYNTRELNLFPYKPN
jgi:hypothetical protein